MPGPRSLLEQELSVIVTFIIHSSCINNVFCLYRAMNVGLQWRIQDFPEEWAPTPGGGANIQFCHIFPKTA